MNCHNNDVIVVMGSISQSNSFLNCGRLPREVTVGVYCGRLQQEFTMGGYRRNSPQEVQ